MIRLRARTRRAAILLPFLLPLAGCTPPPIDLTVQTIGGKLGVALSQDWGIIFPSRKAPCVQEIALYPEGFTSGPIWRAEAKGDVQCLDLAAFMVGVAPRGFAQTLALPANAKGRYELRVMGIGSGGAAVTL